MFPFTVGPPTHKPNQNQKQKQKQKQKTKTIMLFILGTEVLRKVITKATWMGII